MKWLVSQDRDTIFPYTGELTSEAVENNGIYFGINLYHIGLSNDDEATMEKQFLGNFDSPEEIVQEMTNIINTDLEIYPVSGYSDYDGEEDFQALRQYANSLAGDE